jgi:hypothetical protein
MGLETLLVMGTETETRRATQTLQVMVTPLQQLATEFLVVLATLSVYV